MNVAARQASMRALPLYCSRNCSRASSVDCVDECSRKSRVVSADVVHTVTEVLSRVDNSKLNTVAG